MNGTGSSGMTLAPTNGNVYQITYTYLGFGNVFFYIISNITGLFILVHVFQYANTNTT